MLTFCASTLLVFNCVMVKAIEKEVLEFDMIYV